MSTEEQANTEASAIQNKNATIPIEVFILTPDHEIYGIIYVARETRDDRRMSDLLNDPHKRFLAVTDVQLINRIGPSTPRVYSFLQLHIDNIIMIHPSTQAAMRTNEYTKEEAIRFDGLRNKVNQAPSS